MSFFSSFADRITAFIGSWKFILLQTGFIALWMLFNHPGQTATFDPYPWILLNLCMSTQAMYTGPVVMVSQNKQEAQMAAQRERMEHMLEHIESLDTRLEEHVELLNRKLDLLMERAEVFPLGNQARVDS